jgi:hypothetical protein
MHGSEIYKQLQVIFYYYQSICKTPRGSVVVKALGYKPKGRGFKTR